MTHGVLVQPSAYGSNHQLLLDGLAQSPDLRGVAVVRVQDAQLCAKLRQLRTGGVRGLRDEQGRQLHRRGVPMRRRSRSRLMTRRNTRRHQPGEQPSSAPRFFSYR